MNAENSETVLAEDRKRREFFEKQGEKLDFYESLICQLEDIFKEFIRVAPPVIAERDRNKLLLAKKIFKDNYEAYCFLLDYEIKSIFERALRSDVYDGDIAKNDILFLEKAEKRCDENMIGIIRDYYAKMAVHKDTDTRAAAQHKLNEFLQ